jgi:sec-independent protein translocase protein TatA
VLKLERIIRMDLGTPELLIILVLVILLFGVGRIGKLAGELGKGIREFRQGLQGDEPAKVPPAAMKPEEEDPSSIDPGPLQ